MTALRQPAGIAALALALMMVLLVAPATRAEAAIANLQVTTPSSADRVAGKVNARYDIQFTTGVASTATQIIVTFPPAYTVGATATVQDTAGNANRITLNGVTNTALNAGNPVSTNPATNQVIINLGASTGLSGGLNGFRIQTGVTNPTVSGVTAPITVTTNALGETLGSATVTITPGALTNASVVPATTTPGATGNVVVTFTTANPLPTNGRIVVTLPNGFALNSTGATIVDSKNFAEAVTTSVSGRTATVQLLGGGAGRPAGSVVTLRLTNVRNPENAGQTGQTTLATQTSGGAVIDTATVGGTRVGPVQRFGPQHAHKVTVCHNGKTMVIASSAAANRSHQPNFRLGAC